MSCNSNRYIKGNISRVINLDLQSIELSCKMKSVARHWTFSIVSISFIRWGLYNSEKVKYHNELEDNVRKFHL